MKECHKKSVGAFLREVTPYKNFYGTLLIVWYFILYAAPDYIRALNPTICNALCLLIAMAAFFLTWEKNFTALEKREVGFYALVWVLHVSAIAYNKNISLTSMVHVLKHFFVAAAMVRVRLNRKAVSRSYWCIFLFFASFMLVGMDPSTVPHSISQNAIGIHILQFMALYMIADPNKKSLQMMLVVLSTAVICVWTGSRTSLIAVLVVLFGLLIQHLPDMRITDLIKKITKTGWIIIGIIAVLIIAGVVALNVIEFPEGSYLYLLTRDRSPIWGNVRFAMIREYFTAMVSSAGNFIFGANFHMAPLIAEQSGNPHNAFVFAYGNYGLVFFVTLVGLTAGAFFHLFKVSKPVAFLLAGLVLRCMGDIPAFPGVYDGLFYYLIFEYFLVNDVESRKVFHAVLERIGDLLIRLGQRMLLLVNKRQQKDEEQTE